MHTSFVEIQGTTSDLRLNELNRLQILDSASDKFLRNITFLLKQFFKCRIAIISFIDKDRVFYKEVVGGEFTGQSIPFSQSPCSFAVNNDDMTILDGYPDIESAAYNAYKFQVETFGLEFYAGVPLKSRGYSIGMLAIVDEKPMVLTELDKEFMTGLAKIVVDELELRLSALEEINHHKLLNEALLNKNEEILTQYQTIEAQSLEIGKLNKELFQANQLLKVENESLSEGLYERSSKLRSAYRSLIVHKKELETIIYHTSHGLRGPVSTTLGLVNLIRLERSHLLIALEKIEEVSRNMNRTLDKLSKVHDILRGNHASKVGSNGSISINSLIVDILKSSDLNRDIKKCNVKLFVPDIIISRNIEVIQCIVFNLIENAVLHSKTDIEGYERLIKVKVLKTQRFIEVIVSNNGTPIPNEFKSKLYDMFSRGDNRAGSGLGLFIVKKLAQQFHYKIEFESSPGQLTIFKLKIPLTDTNNEIL